MIALELSVWQPVGGRLLSRLDSDPISSSGLDLAIGRGQNKLMKLSLKTTSFFLTWLILSQAIGQTAPATPTGTVTTLPAKNVEVSLPNADDLLRNLDYPELQVVPRASERLVMEGEAERAAPYFVNWMISVPALATLSAVQMASGSYREDNPLTDREKSEADQIVNVARLIAGGGLVAGLALPSLWGYRDGVEKMRAVKDKDKKSLLLRERLSEEYLEKQSSVMTMVRYGFAVANLGALGAVANNARSQEKTYLYIAGVVGLLPILFTPRQIDAYRKQQEYKKKIYTPVAGLGLNYSSLGRNFYPEYQLLWTF